MSGLFGVIYALFWYVIDHVKYVIGIFKMFGSGIFIVLLVTLFFFFGIAEKLGDQDNIVWNDRYHIQIGKY